MFVKSPFTTSTLAAAILLTGLSGKAFAHTEAKPQNTPWKAFNEDNYRIALDNTSARSGRSSVKLHALKEDPLGYGSYSQRISAHQYRGKRIRVSAWLKGQSIEGKASVWSRVHAAHGPALASDNMQDRELTGTQYWNNHYVVLDVADHAEAISFGVMLEGKGTLWADAFKIEVVDDAVATTDSSKKLPDTPYIRTIGILRQTSLNAPQNLDFSAPAFGEKDAWWASEHVKKHFQVGLDKQTKRNGKPTVHIGTDKLEDSSQIGVFLQKINATDFIGKRIKFSADVKTDAVAEHAGLWLRVSDENSGTLAFDNMQNRPIKGDNDWSNHSIELDVHAGADSIAFGTLLIDQGHMWIDNVKLDVTGKAKPPVQKYNGAELPKQAKMMGFEPTKL